MSRLFLSRNTETQRRSARRLPASQFILFTVKRYQNSMGALESYPGAARALAASIRRKNTSSLIRNGLAAKDNGAAVLGYLDRLTARAGLPPGEPAVSISESVHID
jgi:hypothetical protein